MVAVGRWAGVALWIAVSAQGRAVDAQALLPAASPHGVHAPIPAGRTSLPGAHRVFDAQLDELLETLDTLAARVGSTRGDPRAAFRRVRTAYKRAEAVLAYYAPTVVTALEGPLEAEGADDILPRPYNTPGAFPAVESVLFSGLSDATRPGALDRVRAIRERVEVVRSLSASLVVDGAAVFDAARAELARVSTLDIAGYDSDRQDDALADAAAALDGVRHMLAAACGPPAIAGPAASSYHHADSTLQAAALYLRQNAAFESMDRFTFVTRYAIPAAHALADLRAAQSIPPSSGRLAPSIWRDDVASVYDSGAFDATVYAGALRLKPQVIAPIAALGGRLFADPRLSGPRTRACSTCHVPARAFTDGLAKRLSLTPGQSLASGAPPARRTPTLLNAALQPALFDDERAQSLEQQVVAVLSNPDEMGSSLDTAFRRVAADSAYRAAFGAAFGAPPERAVTPITLRVALASYVRSLVALNSPFDRALRGDSAAIEADARRGFTTFMGKGRCGTCHFAPLFNGVEPPAYRTSDPEIIGVPDRPVLEHAHLDPDAGRGAIDRVASHDFAFKVPTVRNAALTAPYMHNGVFRTLDEVIAFYNAGGGRGIGIDLPYQTLFDRPLALTPAEQHDLIAFLRALTDTSVAPGTVSLTGR